MMPWRGQDSEDEDDEGDDEDEEDDEDDEEDEEDEEVCPFRSLFSSRQFTAAVPPDDDRGSEDGRG